MLGYIRHGVAFADCLRSIKSKDGEESEVGGAGLATIETEWMRKVEMSEH